MRQRGKLPCGIQIWSVGMIEGRTECTRKGKGGGSRQRGGCGSRRLGWTFLLSVVLLGGFYLKVDLV